MSKIIFKDWLEQHRESQNTIVQDYRGHITSYEEALYYNGFRDYKVVRWDKRIDEKDKALFDFTGIPEDRRKSSKRHWSGWNSTLYTKLFSSRARACGKYGIKSPHTQRLYYRHTQIQQNTAKFEPLCKSQARFGCGSNFY